MCDEVIICLKISGTTKSEYVIICRQELLQIENMNLAWE